MIPEHTRAALDRYINHKYLPGSFLMAVLINDLYGAVGHADSENLAALPDIVRYIYNELPGNSWGSRERVWEFVKDDFFQRVGKER